MIAGWWWDEEEEKEGKAKNWDGIRRARRERVFSATLRARMRVEQRNKRDRTRIKLERGD